MFGRGLIADRFGLELPADPAAFLADNVRAAQLAQRHLDLLRVKAAEAERAQVEKPLAEALSVTESRLSVIAATETFSAANAEMVRGAELVSAETGIQLMKEWNAEGDACPECAELDGERVPVSASFSSGLEPGSAHPQCRCWTEIFAANDRAA